MRAKHILIVLVLGSTCYGQMTQMGSDIDGEASSDNFGGDVSISDDGTRVIIGATGNDGNGSSAGHARVFSWNGSAWSQMGADIDGEAAYDELGGSVDISGDGTRIAVGAIDNDAAGSNAGHVRVFEWNGSAWTLLGNDIDGEAAGDLSGRCVALSDDGSIVAIGADGNDGSASGAGHVRVYQWNGSSWGQLGSDIDGEAASDDFGEALALSGDGTRLAVGAGLNDGTGSSAGHVRVFDWNGSAWVQIGSDLDGEAAGDNFGGDAYTDNAVALSNDGSRLAVGGSRNAGNGSTSGHVRVFDWDGSSWVRAGSDIDGAAAGDESGASVSISSDGNRISIDSPGNDGSASNAGHVRIFDWNGTDWIVSPCVAEGEASSDFSGVCALSGDGLTMIVGGPRNDGNGSNSGHARIFDISDDACNVPLPVELISFEVQCESDGVSITWATASEIDNDFFSIEESYDGVNYYLVENVYGAGNSNSEVFYSRKYSVSTANDEQPSYYRLKQTDINGKVTIEGERPVDCGQQHVFNFYPNPVQDVVCFELEQAGSIRVYSTEGTLMYIDYLKEGITQSDFGFLKRGIYIIEVIVGNEVERSQFIKN